MTGEMTEELIISGADVVKVKGVRGAACQTSLRLNTHGVSFIRWASDQARKLVMIHSSRSALLNPAQYCVSQALCARPGGRQAWATRS